jgi:hypothetical protein
VQSPRNQAAGLPGAVVALVALGWLCVILGARAGGGGLLDHDSIFAAGVPSIARCAGFAVAWFVMVCATMLPSIALAPADQTCATRDIAAYLAGYFAICELFGVGLLFGDGLLHYAVDTNVWLRGNEYLVAAGVFGLVAFGEFHVARRIRSRGAPFLVAPAQRSPALVSGFALGCRSLAGCGAIMVFMLAASLHDPLTMGVLAALIAYQERGRFGAYLAQGLGIAALGNVLVVLTLRASPL